MNIYLYHYRFASVAGGQEHRRAALASRRHVSRQILRSCLSHHAQVAPDAWGFQRGEYGKPALLSHQQRQYRLQFNLSHSRDWLVLAIADDADANVFLGVDVEQPKARRNLSGIAQHYFSEAENAQLGGLAEADFPRVFYPLWVLKESYVKATGRGLAQSLQGFGFQLPQTGVPITTAWQTVLGTGMAKNVAWYHAYRPFADGYLGLTLGLGHGAGHRMGFTADDIQLIPIATPPSGQ
ncbi:4'-phosphopantetheinyl transferase family protein [Shewanella sp. YIC-542]|uniref:4'-phosphopantetheinyl transferase family protein n=1 Tax=Shewanella mytili TaxID=3377111 RepID=UPI00398EB9FB